MFCTRALRFRKTSAMQNTTYERVPEATCSDVLQMGAAPPPSPRCFVMQAHACKTQPVNGCKKLVCSDLRQCHFCKWGSGFIGPQKPLPLLFRKASTMQNTTYQRVQEATCSDLCRCFANGGVSLLCTASKSI